MFRNAIAGLKGLHTLNLITWCQFVPKVLTPMHIPTCKGVWEFTSPWTLCIVRLLEIYHSVGTKKTHWGFCLHFLIPVMLRVFVHLLAIPVFCEIPVYTFEEWVFNFQMYRSFFVFFQFVIFESIILWTENVIWMVPILWNFLRLAIWLTAWWYSSIS